MSDMSAWERVVEMAHHLSRRPASPTPAEKLLTDLVTVVGDLRARLAVLEPCPGYVSVDQPHPWDADGRCTRCKATR